MAGRRPSRTGPGPDTRPHLKIEINTREHFTILGFANRRTTADNPWYSSSADIITFEIDELLATKLRALYQRRKGRDLFDLWLSISRAAIDPQRVVTEVRVLASDGTE